MGASEIAGLIAIRAGQIFIWPTPFSRTHPLRCGWEDCWRSEASPLIHRAAVAGTFIDSGPGVFLDEPAAGAFIGERGGEGQTGQEEQAEDGEFGLHGGVVSQAISPGDGKSLTVFRIFLKKMARAEAGDRGGDSCPTGLTRCGTKSIVSKE